MTIEGNDPELTPDAIEAQALASLEGGFDPGTQAELALKLLERHRKEVVEASGFVRSALVELVTRQRSILAKRDQLSVFGEADDDVVQQLEMIHYEKDDDASSPAVTRFRYVDPDNLGRTDPNFSDNVNNLRQLSTKVWPTLLCAASAPPVMKGGSGPHTIDRELPPCTDRSAGAGVQIAVVDTGIWEKADERTDGWLDGLPETSTNVDPLDEVVKDTFLDLGAGHGTFVAGLIRLLAPGSDIRVYRALDSDGSGTDQSVATAIEQAAAGGAQIIHLSLGGPGLDDPKSTEVIYESPPEITAAIDALHSSVLVVASAGNDGTPDPVYPAAIDRVVAVGALTRNRRRASWSSYGPWVDVWTVGEGAISTFVAGTSHPVSGRDEVWHGSDPVAMWSGTSFAAPQVTGRIAARMTERSGCLRLFRRRPLTPRQAYTSLLEEAEAIPGAGPYIKGVQFKR